MSAVNALIGEYMEQTVQGMLSGVIPGEEDEDLFVSVSSWFKRISPNRVLYRVRALNLKSVWKGRF